MNIDFPQYFDKNPNFESLMLGSEKFVEYAHQLDSIKNVQLNINQTFLVYVLHGQAKFVTPTKTTFADEGNAVLVRKGAYIMSESLSATNNQFKAFLFFISDQMVINFFAENQLEFSPYTRKQEENATVSVLLNSSFQAYIYQTTPAKWIKEKRLIKAHQLLESTNFSVDEIGKYVGFYTVDSFIQAYKIKYKTTPSNS